MSFSKLKYKVSNFSGKDYNFNTTKYSYNCDNVSAQRNLKNSHSMCCWSNFWSPLISDQLRQSPTIGPYFPIGPILNVLQMIFNYFFFFATSNLFIYYEKARGVHMFLRKDEIFVILRDICPKIPRPQFLFWGQKRVFCDICISKCDNSV